jgi:hypothetical protein
MTHRKLEFPMPANEFVVFDAFHHHYWRARWDSLVSATHVLGGSPSPFVGAITENTGAGALRGLSMRTQFVSYDRPLVAAATMLGYSFPFTRWAASMRHRATGFQESMLIYTYNFEVGPTALRWMMEPIVGWIFDWQTKRRFTRLRDFLKLHASEVEAWQLEQTHKLDANAVAATS